VAVQDTGCAKYDFTVHAVPHLFGRERHMMRELRNYPQPRPFALEIIARDFVFEVSHRRNVISFVAGTLNSAAAFSTAVASSGAYLTG
jgi:hypothetical protein